MDSATRGQKMHDHMKVDPEVTAGKRAKRSTQVHALAKELLLFENGRRCRSQLVVAMLSIIVAIIISLLIFWPISQSVVSEKGLPNDLHMGVSLGMAATSVVCGKFSTLPPGGDVSILYFNPSIISTPVIRLFFDDARGLSCRDANQQFLQNEYGLYYIMVAVLKLLPNLSISEIIQVFTVFRMAILTFVVFILYYCGFGLTWTILITIAAVQLDRLLTAYHPLSNYSFLMLDLPAYAGCIVLLDLFAGWISPPSRGLRPRRVLFSLGGSIAIGLAAAALANAIYQIRTEHGIVAIVMFIVYAVFISLHNSSTSGSREVGKRWGKFASGVALTSSFVVGWLAVYHIALEKAPSSSYNRSYHVIAHPLILGLAVPQNSLAAREGIKWDDSAALALARRMDPDVNYLDKKYEAALFKNYFGLWVKYPLEMATIYLNKARTVGYDMLRNIRPFIAKFLLMPLLIAVDGRIWILLLVAWAVLSMYFKRESAVFHVLLATAAITKTGIALVIFPYFVLGYQSVLVFLAIIFGALIWQGIAVLAWWLGNRWVIVPPSSNSGYAAYVLSQIDNIVKKKNVR